MFIFNIIVYLLSFGAIWLGAGLIVKSIEHFAHKLRLSTFAVSFFILGLLTSIPELALGLTAVSEKTPSVFVGNLLGGIIVLFLLVIPLLAVLGNGIQVKTQLSPPLMIFTLLVILAPSFLTLDKRVTNLEGGVMIVLYALLFFLIESRKGMIDREHSHVMRLKSYSLLDILKIISGIVIVFISSNIIMDKTLYFSQVFQISPFYISLLFLALGTNMPELSLAIRAVMSGKKDVAFGDYLGSAAANTLLFGVFTLLNEGEVLTENSFLTTFIFIAAALGFFYYFSRSKNDISRKEGIILLCIYGAFIFFEVFHS